MVEMLAIYAFILMLIQMVSVSPKLEIFSGFRSVLSDNTAKVFGTAFSGQGMALLSNNWEFLNSQPVLLSTRLPRYWHRVVRMRRSKPSKLVMYLASLFFRFHFDQSGEIVFSLDDGRPRCQHSLVTDPDRQCVNPAIHLNGTACGIHRKTAAKLEVEDTSVGCNNVSSIEGGVMTHLLHLPITGMVAFEETIYTKGGIVHKGYDSKGEPFRRVLPTWYGNAFITAMDADVVVVRRYDKINDENRNNIQAEMAQMNPTFVYRSGTKPVVMTVMDRDEDGKFTTRAWNDLRVFQVNENVDNFQPKLFKRLAILSAKSYLFDQALDLSQFDVRYVNKKIKGTDGEIYISQRLRDHLIDLMVFRMEADPIKAARLAKKMKKTWVFSNFRMVTDKGLIKGDAIVMQPWMAHKYQSDVVVFPDNLKTELVGNAVVAPVTMQPKGQYKPVRTNRQVLGMLGEFLYGEDYILVRNAMIAHIDGLIEQLHNGTLVPSYRNAEYGDPIESITDKAHYWVNSGLSMNATGFLTAMVGENVVKSMTPEEKDDDKKRRLPVPFAKIVSIRSENSMRMAYGSNWEKLPDGTVYFDHKYGIVVADDIFDEFMLIAGGGDLDDTVDAHLRISPIDIPVFGVKRGDMVAVCVRNPVGVVSNGSEIGIEYQIRPVHGMYEMVPMLNINRPKSVIEVELDSEPQFQLADDLENGNEYSKKFVWSMLNGLPEDAFGSFVNLMITFAYAGIPFPYIAAMEDVVDACQQTMNPVDIDEVAKIVEQLKLILADGMLEMGVEVDYHLLRRLGMMKREFRYIHHLADKDGDFCRLIAFHKSEVERFADELEATVTRINDSYSGRQFVKRFANDSYGHWSDNKTRTFMSQVRRESGKDFHARDMSESDRNEFGKLLYSKWEEKVADGAMSLDLLLETTAEGFAYTIANPRSNTKFPEKHYYYGDMFYLLVSSIVKAVEENTAEQLIYTEQDDEYWESLIDSEDSDY